MRHAALLLVLGLTLGGCAARAERLPTPVMPPLDVPPVPARVIVPEIDEAEAAAVDDAASAASRPAPARPTEPAKTAEKPETPAPAPAPPETPRVRTPQTANDEQAASQVRAVLGRADGTLNNVDYRALSAAARQQYDTAKRFITQAENALKIRNYVFARNLADKADTLARQLGK